MDQDSKEKTLEKLTKAENILIVVSQSSGFDGLAAGLAAYLSCRKLNKNSSIIAPPPTVDDARKLYGVDQIDTLNERQNLTIVIENAVRNVDKVSYFLDRDRLKIIVHPLPEGTGISREEISFEQNTPKPDLIFVLGFSTQEDMDKEYVHEQLMGPKVWTVVINKNQMSQKFAQATFYNPEASGLSEITAQVIQDLALPIDEDIAFNLYSGLSYSTGNFSPARTRSQAFQIASWLVKFGAGRASFAENTTYAHEPQDFAPESFHTEPISQSAPGFVDMTPIEKVEQEKTPQQDWLKPPKIYKGAKSFDKEY